MKELMISIGFLFLVGCDNSQIHEKQKKNELKPHVKFLLQKSWKLISLEVKTVEKNEYITVFDASSESINDFIIEFKKDGKIQIDNKVVGQWIGEDKYLILHGRNKDGIKMDLNGRYYIHAISDDLLWLSKGYFNNKSKNTLELVYRFRDNQHVEEARKREYDF